MSTPASLFLVASLIVAPSAHAADESAMTVMTYNIRGDFDQGAATDKREAWIANNGDHRRDRLLSILKEADPDLLGAQEAYANQVDEIAAALPGHDVYAVGRDDGKRAGEHCAIYYRTERFEREGSGTFWLCEQSDTPGSRYPGAACPRIASWVRLRDNAAGRSLLIVNAHWDHVSAAAREYAATLIRDRAHDGEDATLVMGDFNATEDSAPLRTLLDPDTSPVLTDAYRAVHPERSDSEGSFHGYRGGASGRRIDYLLCTEALKPVAAAILRNDATADASDHYPVTATLEWREP